MKPNEAFDPYKILDIAVDADESAIRRAFRKKVRATHPDSGGSSESFQELKMAYDLLSDKERRRLFDETGDLSEKSLDPDQKKIIEILSIGLDKALFKTATDPLKYNHSKILELVRAEIEQQRSELLEQKINFEHALHLSQDLLDRFTVMDGRNLMRDTISKRINICEHHIDHIKDQIESIDKALVHLEKTQFQMPVSIQSNNQPTNHTAKFFKGYHPLLDWGDLIKF